MTLTQLSYVVALDAHRHFGRAAEQCCVSQPTLSMQVQKLEEELGILLFDRSRQPVVPTDLGREVIAQARVVLRESARIPDLIAASGGELRGELSLGIIPTLAPYLLPLVARPFADAYPGVAVSVREMPTQQILAALHRDELDAGLIATPEAEPGLVVVPLFRETFVAYVSPDHPMSARAAVAAGDLAAGDLWLLSDGHCFRDQVLALCGEDRRGDGRVRNPIFESGNLETLCRMVEWGGGMTLLPLLATHYLTDEQRRRYVRPFEAPAPYRDVSVVYGRAYLKRHLIDAYRAMLEAVLPRDGLALAGR